VSSPEEGEFPHVDGMKAFFDAMSTLVGFEPAEVSVSPDGNQVRILARIPGANGAQWLKFLKAMRQLERKSDWSLDPSKLYFLLGDDDDAEMRYAWRLIFKSRDLPKTFADLKGLVKLQAPRKATAQLTEVNLPGATASRNAAAARGKGARPTPGSGESSPAMEFFRR